MATTRVDPAKLGQLEARLSARLGTVNRRAALSAAMRGVGLMQHRTRTAPPANPSGVGQGGAVNTGDYLRRWRAARMPDGNAVLFNSAAYAGVIDLGRRAGARMPPVERIARWVQRRLGVSYEDARGVAFTIARSIARRGLLARRVMTHPSAQRQMTDFLLKEFTHELDVEIARLVSEEGA